MHSGYLGQRWLIAAVLNAAEHVLGIVIFW